MINTIAEIHVAHNLPNPLCRLIDKIIIFLVCPPSSFRCEIFNVSHKLNIRITFILWVIFQDEHLLDWSNLIYLIIHAWKKSIRYNATGFWGMLFLYCIALSYCIVNQIIGWKRCQINMIGLHIGLHQDIP